MTSRLSLLLVGLAASACLAGIAYAVGEAGPPRYRSCARVPIGLGIRTPVYAHNVSCNVAEDLVARCSGSKRVCFGEMALPYNGHGEPYLSLRHGRRFLIDRWS